MRLPVKNPAGYFPQIAFGRVNTKSSGRPKVLNNSCDTIHSNLKTKRVSLITGKLMTHPPVTSKRSKQYKRIQMTIYNFLERPTGCYSVLYQLMMYENIFLLVYLKFVE